MTTIHSQEPQKIKIKCIGINLTTEMKDLYNKSHKNTEEKN
jgi:hypothetical protein